MKRILLGIVALVLLLSMNLPAFAATQSAPPLADISKDLSSSSGSWSSMLLSSDFAISYISYSISKVSSSSVRISATTQTNQDADIVGGTMYIQKWVNGAWTNFGSRSFNAYGTDECSDSATWTVDSGYYYRLRTYHRATLETDVVARNSYTGSIFVD